VPDAKRQEARRTHRGYIIEVHRDKCLGGWGQWYYTVSRRSGLIVLDNFEDSNETLDDMIKNMKIRIDNELASDDPWGLKAKRAVYGA